MKFLRFREKWCCNAQISASILRLCETPARAPPPQLSWAWRSALHGGDRTDRTSRSRREREIPGFFPSTSTSTLDFYSALVPGLNYRTDTICLGDSGHYTGIFLVYNLWCCVWCETKRKGKCPAAVHLCSLEAPQRESGTLSAFREQTLQVSVNSDCGWVLGVGKTHSIASAPSQRGDARNASRAIYAHTLHEFLRREDD